jgi:hypothetical protein
MSTPATILEPDVRRPLPAPTVSGDTPHRVTFGLSAGEFACLSVLAERWGCTPDNAACVLVCMDLDRRYLEEAQSPPAPGWLKPGGSA